ncbi:unnamed protein product [Macrosiphum euphorbiae]|uniref:Uncharacterized protein n=1 Tax=Macrosiphum euphorbiae TaxID=13131 RepID=A0AAV0YCT1_9HEMI|nr:unnamed protein product [Macrosiphum euphorbiae]
MAEKILQELPEREPQKKYIVKFEDVQHFLDKDLPLDLLGPNSKNVFKRFNIPEIFLKVQPEKWHELEEYQKGKSILNSIKVVNDTAERGVKLMQEYNDKFTTNEDQKQFVLQVVQDCRKQYPGFTRDTLKKPYT